MCHMSLQLDKLIGRTLVMPRVDRVAFVKVKFAAAGRSHIARM